LTGAIDERTGSADPMNDVVDLIERDHRDLEEQLAKLAATLDVAVARRLHTNLQRHLDAEAAVIHPVIAAAFPNGQLVAGEGEDDRNALRSIAERIVIGPSDRLPGLVEDLRVALEVHVDTEESEVLPLVRAVLEPSDFRALAPVFSDAKGQPGPEV
jgi:hypothetical protein